MTATRGRQSRQAMPPGSRSRLTVGARWKGLGTGAKIGYISATLLTAGAVAVSLVGYSLYLHLNHNITTAKVQGLTGRANYGAQNILILGSQTRDGQGPGFGYDPGTNLSDNLLLVHLDTTHTHATVVSIPRDTMVYEPQCQSRFNNQVVPANPKAIIDGAMNLGGPSCAVATVTHLSGITMDHFIEFNFNSFRALVNTLGGSQGIPVCLKQPVNDPYSNLHLGAGIHYVTGNQALAFVRTRHGVGDGTDLGRIELQQEFFSSLIQQVKSANTLGNPLKLYDLANTSTQALTVDPGLGSVSKLLSLAATMRNLHTNNVNFITMPTVVDPTDQNRLLPEQPEDDIIWQMLQNGTPWQGGLPLAQPSAVPVTVLNATGIGGLATKTETTLKQFGYNVTSVGNASYTWSTTVTYPSQTLADGAYTLMGTLKQPPVVQTGGTSPGITLTLGANFSGLINPPPPPPTASPAATPAASKGAKSPAAAASTSAPPVSTTPAAGQQPNGQQDTVPGQSAGIETRNAAQNICGGILPNANPNTGAP